jgi:hypothetical protein
VKNKRQFGIKVVPPKVVLKELWGFFEHPDKTVRTEAVNLTVEMYRWLGPVIRQQVKDNLRDAQVRPHIFFFLLFLILSLKRHKSTGQRLGNSI